MPLAVAIRGYSILVRPRSEHCRRSLQYQTRSLALGSHHDLERLGAPSQEGEEKEGGEDGWAGGKDVGTAVLA